MAESTSIAWCDHTFNPWRGCAKVSPGCALCYAERQARRFPANRGVWGPDGTRVVAAETTWLTPYGWSLAALRKGVRRTVFSASLGDWLDEWGGQLRDASEQPMFVGPDGLWVRKRDRLPRELPAYRPLTLDHARDRLLALVAATRELTWLLLSKRPERFEAAMEAVARLGTLGESRGGAEVAARWLDGQAPPNVIAGASVEDEERMGRLRDLRRIPGRHFLSVEPLLGPIDMTGLAMDWVIVGGESGPKARPCDLLWIGSIVEQCRSAGVPVFVKQLGARPEFDDEGDRVRIALSDPKGGDPAEWPRDLRVRECPSFEESEVAR